ncbi:bifunctional alpha/beta hydrolase/OsmC family protein [Aliiroseovarius crassostreae]|uniref:bifunctional alpha/beta hydrolase/OsmC family protein n=1 Tax=Aliiroseovarius crassostreae TaxID=154981 RepID=UPI00220605CA|nr:bifunctional alpha/beta hydrolase/OsmC family protein [Aliiroseovarius crassostreae]UWP90044.1 bifunctional alpha/beta hydrolase/OsmC family protein [Aliiroseovarius crassostreae]
MPTERFTFKGHGGDDLAGRLNLPSGPHLGTALFAHCFTCGKDIAAARRIADRLAGLGIAVLRFDFTGLGQSDGAFEHTHFSSNVEDILLAAQALKARGMAPDLLIGHSLGGAAILRATAQLPDTQAVVTIGAPSTPANVIRQFETALPDLNAEGTARVQLGGRPFTLRQSLVDDLQEQKIDEAIHNLNAALLVLHAPRDEVVSIDHAAKIFMAAKHPKSFITLDDADHLITRQADAEYVAEVISAWATRYTDLTPPAPPIGAPEGIVRVAEADADGFLQDIQAGPFHHTQADEPMAYGGTNKGMSPYGFLSAGLGACTSMTIRMYARRKGWPLTHVRVDVSHNKVHAQDADTSTRAKIDKFRREVMLDGPLSQDQRHRLLEIADRCPVHRTLEGTSDVETVLVEA